jgi:hypothetical protein
MPGSDVLADVSETLLKLLRDQLAGVVASDHVTLASPSDVEVDNAPWLALFLYQVSENQFLKNEPHERIDSSHRRIPPYVVDLSYLLVPYAQSRETEQQILGKVLQVLSSHQILKGSLLQRDLAGSDEELHVVFRPLSLEDMFRLWSAFPNKPYKLSLSYQVTPVRIDSVLPPLETKPVLEKLIRVNAAIEQ